MSTDLEFIQGFSPLFAHLYGSTEGSKTTKKGKSTKIKELRSPMGATGYYIFLIKNFPTNFTIINREAKKAMGSNINESKLQRGRQDLLEHGFISQVLPVSEGDIKSNFNREAYIPISPKLAWDDNVHNLKGKITPEELAHRETFTDKLEQIYRENFGKYGVSVEKGSITLFHSHQWLLYFLANNMNGKSIRMQLGALGSFEEPYIKYYEKMLRSGLETKIICDPATNAVKKRINNIIDLNSKLNKDGIPIKQEIKTTLISQDTSRRMIYDNLAIDGRKLAFDSDLSYISTIYFDEKIVSRMKDSFDLSFETCQDISKYLGKTR